MSSSLKPLEELFEGKWDAILAERVVRYYTWQQADGPRPIELDGSMIAYFTEDFQDLVDGDVPEIFAAHGRMPLETVCVKITYRVGCEDAESKLRQLLTQLQQADYLVGTTVGYVISPQASRMFL